MQNLRSIGSGLVACGAACTMALSSMVHASVRNVLGVPQDDDWAYIATALRWEESGQFELNGWVHMMFVGQGAIGSLIARTLEASILSLQLVVLSFGALGLVGIYAIARLVLPVSWSLFVLLVTGFSPPWLRLSVTFMTDIPAWSLSVVSVWVALRFIRTARTRWLVFGGIFATAAFTVREYGIIPFAVLLVFLAVWERSWRNRVAVVAILTITFLITFGGYAWRSGLPGAVINYRLPLEEALVQCGRFTLSLALLILPFLIAFWLLVRPSLSTTLSIFREYWKSAVAGFSVSVCLLFLSGGQLLGNSIHPYGSSWTSVGDGIVAFPPPIFSLLSVISALSLLVLGCMTGILAQWAAGNVTRRADFDSHPSLPYSVSLVVISLGSILFLFITVIGLGAPIYDRYLLIPVPLLGIVTLKVALSLRKQTPCRSVAIPVVVILAIYGGLSFALTDSTRQIDGVRWEVASDLAASGIPSYKIDGGDAWFRYHQKDAPGVAQVGSLENSIPGRTWWQTFFEGSTFCRMVAIESETDLQAIYGPALSIQEERTLLGTPFRIMVFPGPDPC